jgi:glycolate oxidase iron-sulfur subunit
MEFCLLCRHCESVCPAGVQFGALMEHTRGGLDAAGAHRGLKRLLRWLGFRLVLPNRLALRIAGSMLRGAQVLGLDRLADVLWRGRGLASLPRIPPLRMRRLLPRRLAARGTPRGKLLLLEGCVMGEFHAHVNRATARSLAELGFELVVPESVCCGSLHAHNGDLDGARELARKLLTACRLDEASETTLFVTNSAGCGAHLKELAHLFPADDPWHARAVNFAQRVRDYSQVVAAALSQARPFSRTPELPLPVAWDDPCHLCHAQKVRVEPRAVLAAIPGLEQVELADSESCCGSAGVYSLLRPEASQAVFTRKREALERSGARTLVTANPGCQMQWQSGLERAGSSVLVVHLAEVVASALEAPPSS